jgi:hypothetical protein
MRLEREGVDGPTMKVLKIYHVVTTSGEPKIHRQPVGFHCYYRLASKSTAARVGVHSLEEGTSKYPLRYLTRYRFPDSQVLEWIPRHKDLLSSVDPFVWLTLKIRWIKIAEQQDCTFLLV